MVVVGVLPQTFHFPSWSVAAWRAAAFETADAAPTVYARLDPRIPEADALRLATSIARDADPKGTRDRWAQARRLAERTIDTSYKQALPLLGAGVALLFFVLCANVSSLQLAGITARAREFATRAALGASRARLVGQACIESSLVGMVGVAVGLNVAAALVALARVRILDALSLHSLHVASLDGRALVVTSIAGLAATVAAGVLPAVIGTRVDGQSLQLNVRSGTETPTARAVARGLLVVQIGLSCALLIGAALLMRSFVRLATADRGFDPRQVMIARMDLPAGTGADTSVPTEALRALEAEARAIPGVVSAAWSYYPPPQGSTIYQASAWTPDINGAAPVTLDVYRFDVAPSFFSVLDIPIVRGRAFDDRDDRTAVVVGERFAQALWPGLDPIGRTVTREGAQLRVIGVAREIRFPSLDPNADALQIYSRFVRTFGMAALSLRCSTGADGPRCPDAALVNRRLSNTVPGARAYAVRSLEDSYTREFARPRVAAGLALAFTAAALMAAAAGLFSLLSHVVARRRREFGIRTALGASAQQIRALVVRDGVVVAAIGLGLGVAAGIVVARAMAAFLFGITAADPATWLLVVGVFAATVAAACWHPARTAIRSNPVLLLRDE